MSTQNSSINISTTSSRIMLSSKSTSIPLFQLKYSIFKEHEAHGYHVFLLYTSSPREITSSINTRTLENVHRNHFSVKHKLFKIRTLKFKSF